MNAFESIVAQYLEAEGYWVRQSVKVKITKDDKKAIGLPTMPTPEIDIVALSVKRNELLLVEVKSFLDSQGVYSDAVCTDEYRASKRYRLFNETKYRRIVSKRIAEEYLGSGLINSKTNINYALAAGKIHSGDEDNLRANFSKKGWILITPSEIKNKVKELANKGWEDNLVTMTAKLIMRD